MDFQALVADVVRIVAEAAPLPDWSDRAAVKAFAAKIVPDLIDADFDTAGLQAAHAECAACAPDELESMVSAALPAEKLGDGMILQWLVANLPALLQLFSVFAAKPAP